MVKVPQTDRTVILINPPELTVVLVLAKRVLLDVFDLILHEIGVNSNFVPILYRLRVFDSYFVHDSQLLCNVIFDNLVATLQAVVLYVLRS